MALLDNTVENTSGGIDKVTVRSVWAHHHCVINVMRVKNKSEDIPGS